MDKQQLIFISSWDERANQVEDILLPSVCYLHRELEEKCHYDIPMVLQGELKPGLEIQECLVDTGKEIIESLYVPFYGEWWALSAKPKLTAYIVAKSDVKAVEEVMEKFSMSKKGYWCYGLGHYVKLD